MPTETERIKAKWARYLADVQEYKRGKYAARHPQRKTAARRSADAEKSIRRSGAKRHARVAVC